MKSYLVTRLGPPHTSLTLQTTLPIPGPATGTSLLIRVSHAALNPADVGFMAMIPTLLPFRRTPIPGLDFSGTVVSAGPEAPADLGPGTGVCGAMSVSLVARGNGSLAEYVLVPAALVSRVPDSLGLREACGLGIVGQTALIAVRETGGLKKGDRVLVNGASGGLGGMIVQLAKADGAYVVGVCSEGNAEFVKRLGTVEVRTVSPLRHERALLTVGQTIDYKKHDPLHAYLAQRHAEEQFDFIFDCVGDQVLFEQCTPFLKPAGKFICLTGGKSQGVIPYVKNNLRPVFLGGTPRTYRILGLSPSGDLMRDVVKAYNERRIKEVPIDSEYGMEEVVEVSSLLMLM